MERRAEPIDVGPLTEIVLAHANETAPALAPLIPSGGQIVAIDTDGLPDLTAPMAELDRAVTIAFMAGVALPLALLVHDRRHRVLAWTGQWLIGVGILAGLAAIGLPVVAGQVTGSRIVEIALRPEAMRLLAPAGVIGAIGMGLASVGALWSRREKRRVTEEGAAAWLEVVEPPPAALNGSDSFDLARRGLVDANRHLTSI